MQVLDVACIATQHTGLDTGSADHVVGHQQDIGLLQPLIVLGYGRCQLVDRPGLGVTL
ncbi:hypothetical protein D3C81_2033390 [compost metagenome]